MRYALIGCGRIAPNHLMAAKNNGLELAAVCDTREGQMEELLRSCGLEGAGIRRYTDYRELLQAEHPELTAVATESGSHARVALGCLEQGSHVIVEKPIALSLRDADRMIELAQEQGRVLSVCHQNRFNRSILKIREAVEQGRFGRMLYGTAHIRWNRGRGYYEAAPWRGSWREDGGALMNQCIHNIDLLRWMMGGKIDQVIGYTDRLAHDYIEAEDLGLALIRFQNGSYGLVEGTTAVYPDNLEETLYLFGTTGTVKAGGKSVNRIEEWKFRDPMGDPEAIKSEYSENPPNIYGFGHTPLYADVIQAIQNRRPPKVDGEAGRAALELVLGIYEAAATGRPVKFPLRDAASIDYQGRF